MRILLLLTAALVAGDALAADTPPPDPAIAQFQTLAEPENPAIDMDGFLALADEAARHRNARRVSEATFLALRDFMRIGGVTGWMRAAARNSTPCTSMARST